MPPAKTHSVVWNLKRPFSSLIPLLPRNKSTTTWTSPSSNRWGNQSRIKSKRTISNWQPRNPIGTKQTLSHIITHIRLMGVGVEGWLRTPVQAILTMILISIIHTVTAPLSSKLFIQVPHMIICHQYLHPYLTVGSNQRLDSQPPRISKCSTSRSNLIRCHSGRLKELKQMSQWKWVNPERKVVIDQQRCRLQIIERVLITTQFKSQLINQQNGEWWGGRNQKKYPGQLSVRYFMIWTLLLYRKD